MDFVKYHGCGNDFIIVDEMDGALTPDSERSELAKKLCDRHFSIGADGLIFIELAEGTDGSMRLFEPAGNEADMCGNGLRCVASFVGDKCSKDNLTILTKDGVKSINKEGDQFTVDMGLVRSQRMHLSEYVTDAGSPDDSMMDFSVCYGGSSHQASILNTGEPHIVVLTEDLLAVDAPSAGAELNSDRERFPKGVNINFVKVDGKDNISIRTYERGVYDETMSCGTGATASAAAVVLNGALSGPSVRVATRGGVLSIRLTHDGHAFMTGPANRVFSGSVEVDAR
jgi:diaminopimelate epimerase